jgi:hypothetical protein
MPRKPRLFVPVMVPGSYICIFSISTPAECTNVRTWHRFRLMPYGGRLVQLLGLADGG